MLIMLIMLIKKVAQSCRLGNKAEFVHWPIGNMNQSKNLTLLTISRFYRRQLDYLDRKDLLFSLNLFVNIGDVIILLLINLPSGSLSCRLY